MGKLCKFWPREVETVGAMKAAVDRGELQLKAYCGRCKLAQKVDLDVILRTHPDGRFASLINARGACRRFDCDGQVAFLYRRSDQAPWRPLLD